MTPCHYCSKPIDKGSIFTWKRVVGWERKAKGPSRRGGSDIVCRETREEFACDDCIIRQKRGVAPTQGTLGEAA